MNTRPANPLEPLPWTALVILAVFSGLPGSTSLFAQESEPNRFAQDIAVLIDVSASIKPENSKDARDLVSDLIKARVSSKSSTNWTLVPNSGLEDSPELQSRLANLKQIFNSPSGKPLWEGEKKMIVSIIGDKGETWESTRRAEFFLLKSEGDIDEQLKPVYQLNRFDHKTTFLNLAKGAFALRLKDQEPKIENYYLFVISDEKEDLTNTTTDDKLLEIRNAEWIRKGGYTKAEEDAVKYGTEKIENQKLATFTFKPDPDGPVNVVVYSNTIVENSRQLAFTTPAPGGHKEINEADSRITWSLLPKGQEVGYNLRITPAGEHGSPLIITGITDDTLELLKSHPDHPEHLPLKLDNGKYDLTVETDEDNPLVTESGTSIFLKRLDPEIAFEKPLDTTYRSRPGEKPVLIPHPFASADKVVFQWQVFVKGLSDSPFDIKPDEDIRVALYQVDHEVDLEEPAAGRREIKTPNIDRDPILVAELPWKGARMEAKLLENFILEEVLSGTFVIEVSGKWGNRSPLAQASFHLPRPNLKLLNVKKGRGESSDRRRTLTQGSAVVRFFNTHAGWRGTEYAAMANGTRTLNVQSGRIDLSSLEVGEYNLDVKFLQANPNLRAGSSKITVARMPVYVTIKKSVWLWWVFGFLAAATAGVFGYSLWASSSNRLGNGD